MRMVRWAAAGLALTLGGAALAAEAKGKHAEPPTVTHPMKVVIVADSRAGCEPNCAEWISAEGEIEPGTPALFRRVFKALGQRRLPLFISSGGGSVQAAFAIGREIRKRGLDVAVERTVFQKCEPTSSACDPRALKDGDKGRPEPVGAYCASSCAFILAAGIQRVAPAYAFVGVHELIEFQTYKRVRRLYRIQRRIENGRPVEVSRQLISEEPVGSFTVEKDVNYAPVRAYFTEMGIDTATIMPLVLGTPHSGIHRMTTEERRTTRLVTRAASGTELLPQAAQAAATESATTTPTPAPLQRAAVPSGAFAELTLLYPPGADMIEIYIQLRSSRPQFRTDQFVADIQFTNGARVVARNISGGGADPLYAALAHDDLCALRRSGDLSLKVALRATEHPDPPRLLAFDLAKSLGFVEYAAKRCGK